MMTKVLFVCLGNICRSPTAHGVFLKVLSDNGLIAKVEVDSAGTHAHHIGEAPDPRSQKVALGRGVDLSELRARKVKPSDYGHYDYILAMDNENLDILNSDCPVEHREKVKLFLEFAVNRKEREVPDPYYGGAGGFDHVLDLVEAASLGLLEEIRANN